MDKDHDGFLKEDDFASEYMVLILDRLGVLDLLEIRQAFTMDNLKTLFSALDNDRGKCSIGNEQNLTCCRRKNFDGTI